MVRRSMGKISSELAEQLKTAGPGEPIEVIVELDPLPALPGTGSRAERVAQLRKNFDTTLASVVRYLGPDGRILDSAWINSTIRAELTRDQIKKLEGVENVSRIDFPRAIHAEA